MEKNAILSVKSGKVDCCGGSLSLSKREIAKQLVGEITEMARKAGATSVSHSRLIIQRRI